MRFFATEGVTLSGNRKIGYCNRITLRRIPNDGCRRGKDAIAFESLRQKDRVIAFTKDDKKDNGAMPQIFVNVFIGERDILTRSDERSLRFLFFGNGLSKIFCPIGR